MAGSGIFVITFRPTEGNSGGRSAAVDDVARILGRRGLHLHRMHPEGSELDADRLFFVSGEGVGDPDEVTRFLQRFDQIESVYFKPADEPPMNG